MFFGTRNPPPAERPLIPEPPARENEPEIIEIGSPRQNIPAAPPRAPERPSGFDQMLERVGHYFGEEMPNQEDVFVEVVNDAVAVVNDSLRVMQKFTDSAVLPAVRSGLDAALRYGIKPGGQILVKVGGNLVPLSVELAKFVVAHCEATVGAIWDTHFSRRTL